MPYGDTGGSMSGPAIMPDLGVTSMSGPGIQVPMNPIQETSIQNGYLTGGASYGDDFEDDFSDASMPATGPNGMAIPANMPKAKEIDPNDPDADKSSLDIMLEKMDAQLEVQTALLDAQQQNNKIGKKTQRNIEGLEI
jgi:hypothetical protein